MPSELLFLSIDLCIFPGESPHSSPSLPKRPDLPAVPQAHTKPQEKQRSNMPWYDPKVLLMWTKIDSERLMLTPKRVS